MYSNINRRQSSEQPSSLVYQPESSSNGDLFSEILNNIISASNSTGLSNQNRKNCDIIDSDDVLTVYVDVQGVEKEDINVDFRNNTIKLTTNRKRPYVLEPTDTTTNPVYKSEIQYGEYTRTINIPICVTRRESVNISLKNGVLKIKINKRIESSNIFSVNLGSEDST